MAQVMMPQVNKNEAVNFSKVWTHNGLAIVLSDAHIDFAVDFANVVLKSFVLQCQANFEAALKQQNKNQTQAGQTGQAGTPEVSKIIEA